MSEKRLIVIRVIVVIEFANVIVSVILMFVVRAVIERVAVTIRIISGSSSSRVVVIVIEVVRIKAAAVVIIRVLVVVVVVVLVVIVVVVIIVLVVVVVVGVVVVIAIESHRSGKRSLHIQLSMFLISSGMTEKRHVK